MVNGNVVGVSLENRETRFKSTSAMCDFGSSTQNRIVVSEIKLKGHIEHMEE